MPKKRRGRSSSATPVRSGGGTPGSTVLAFVLGAAAAGGAGYLYLHSASPAHAPVTAPATIPAAPAPVTRVKPPAPAGPSPRTPPFGTSEDVFEAGAHLYAARCASCHGTPHSDAPMTAPDTQLWRSGHHLLASRTPSELYTSIAAGSPAKGMPAYATALTDTQIWQLALLLRSSGQDLPDPVIAILNNPPAHHH